METVADVLEHFGVKGMKWGRRKAQASGPASDDAENAYKALAKAKTQGTKSLSNKEIQDIVTRMNLEQQYSRLNPQKNPVKRGQDFVKEGLAVFGTASAVYGAYNSQLGKALRSTT